ncbi:MoxR-like ATPase [Allocatelliglobosispora scoriae]|uniref:MoxR-like ATPase n=1 Tax=Allocatelliglobosispora scoriae TaxID=643052 RepID=A0A841BHP0_9ACTN|nr:MoxR family ATPase [Allocatelliglobosispora scoriae]MBB5868617.1 MoxR-like ATPase [Allocatelliglobosispora scoriae]
MNGSINPGEAYQRIAGNVSRVIHGKPEVIRTAVACLFAEGHLLIEDVPGLGKTRLARCIAKSISGAWGRIQFTPDLLPSDVTGVAVYNQATQTFPFHEGPIFANIVLADEINRGTPKTQAALLEVMEERTVTVDRETRPVPRPFMVLATQNPVEMDGTYRLPEAQLDRFLMRVAMGYPDARAEVQVLLDEAAGNGPEQLAPVLDLEQLRAVIAMVRRVHVAPAICEYAVELCRSTRDHQHISLGASPRGSVGLMRAARAFAATDGRDAVTPDDVKDVAVAVLEHRLILTPNAELSRVTARSVIEEALRATPVPPTTRSLV